MAVTEEGLGERVGRALELEPLAHPSWFYAGMAALGAAGLTWLSGLGGLGPALAAGCAFLTTFIGWRLGSLVILTICCIVPLIAGRLGFAVGSLTWVFMLALVLCANLRGVLVSAGVVTRSGAWTAPRRYAGPGAESWRDWGVELILAVAALTMLEVGLQLAGEGLSAILGFSAELGWVGGAALGVLLLLGLISLFSAGIVGALRWRRMSRQEAALLLLVDMYRELRSELLFFTRFRAKRRW